MIEKKWYQNDFYKSNLPFGTTSFFVEGDVHKSYSYYSQEKNNLRLGNICIEIHNSSNSSSALIDSNNDTIAATILYVNTTGFCATKMAMNQAAKRFEQTEENTFSCGLVNSKEGFTNFYILLLFKNTSRSSLVIKCLKGEINIIFNHFALIPT